MVKHSLRSNKKVENTSLKKDYEESKNKRKLLIVWILFSVVSAIAIAFIISTIVIIFQKNKTLKVGQSRYDFYITSSTLPTLYATLSAYKQQNPNTYMWFRRGNTISYSQTASYIHYLSGQSQNNSDSNYDYQGMRKTVRDILTQNASAKFHLYCDDQRSRIIFDVFIAAGVNFDALEVTLLSDGTASYEEFSKMTEARYSALPVKWNDYMQSYLNNSNNPFYQHPHFSNILHLEALSDFLTYLPSFPNVTYWIQYPEYLQNSLSPSLQKSKLNMNIIQKSLKAMYESLIESVCIEYQHVVLATALQDNTENLNTLQDAVNYFNTNLSNRDKDVVLILGTLSTTDAEMTNFINQTLDFYTPRINGVNNKVLYKGKEYTTTDGTTITVNGKTLKINELAVYLYFKGHPSANLSNQMQTLFQQHNIKTLPKRTPVEVLFWMYNVKVGGYASTSYLSCEKSQVEFFYYLNTQWSPALQLMGAQGFFDNTTFFQ